MTNTPGALGYLLAWALSDLFFAGILAGTTMVSEGAYGPGDLLSYVLLIGFYVAIVSTPFACAGILFVHFTCRQISQQWVHVLAAATAGAMTGGVLALLAVDLVVLIPLLAASTALARAAVIPLVQERRRRDSVPLPVRC